MNKRHLLIMVLCCLTPVAGLIVLRLLNVPVSGVIYLGLMLLCLLSHVVLMKFLMKGEGHESHAQKHLPRVGGPVSHPEPVVSQHQAGADS